MSLEYDEYKKDDWKTIFAILSIVIPVYILKKLCPEYILTSGLPFICGLFAIGLVHVKYSGTVAWGYNYKTPESFKLRVATVRVIGKLCVVLSIFFLLLLLIFASGIA